MPNRKEPRLEIDEQQPTADLAGDLDAKTEPSSKPTKQAPYSRLPNNDSKSTKQSFSEPSSINTVSPSSTGKVWLAIFLALLALGLLAWQYMQSQQQPLLMQTLGNRIQALEIRLAETGDDLSASGSSFNEKLEWADSEIRKLWVVAHQRNRPAIETLEAKIKQLEQGLSKADKQLSEAVTVSKKAVDKSLALGNDLKKFNDELNFHIKELSQRLTEISLSASTLDQRLRDQDLRTKLAALEKGVANLKSTVDQIKPDNQSGNLQAKLSEQEEILASLEASRAQLVGRVTRLMEEVRELQQAR